MVSIQDIGVEILNKTPKQLYVFGGTEYGIKDKYINILKDHFGQLTEVTTGSSLVDMLSKKHIIPLKPSVYVVRYDETFISELNEALATKVQKLKFSGTIVFLYELPKHINKMDKYFPNSTVLIDSVGPTFIAKYLHTEFPSLPDRLINLAVNHGDNYNMSRNMCRCMTHVPVESLYALTDEQVAALFGCTDASTEAQVKRGIAYRNFDYLLNALENYDEDIDRIMYAILQTLIELDKVLHNSRTNSDLKDCAKYWTREDVYYMFVHTYQELKQSRSVSSYNMKDRLIYLFSLLRFKPIPSFEVINS